jgi:hypothetical protein
VTWFDWLLVGLFLLSTVITIATAGRPREPISPGLAAFIATWNVAIIACLLATRGVLG